MMNLKDNYILQDQVPTFTERLIQDSKSPCLIPTLIVPMATSVCVLTMGPSKTEEEHIMHLAWTQVL